MSAAAWSGPKPPPPVYAAALVAREVVRAAERPSREVPVGGTAIGAILAQRISPALTDALLSTRRYGIGSQTDDRSRSSTRSEDGPGPDHAAADIVDRPVAGPGRVDGGYPGRVLAHSFLTTLAGRGRRPVEHLTRVISRLHRGRPARPRR